MRTRARERIQDFVARHPGATSGQIARGLGMTAPGVRHHLAILIGDGRFELATGAKGGQRGRPAQRFRISQRLEGNNLALVADTALQVMASATDQRARDWFIETLAARLVEQLGPIDRRGPASMRLTAMVARLNALHYAAHWEAAATGPRLSFGRCPYAAVIQNHPELCLMDARAISDLTGTGAEQTAKIDVNSRTPNQCVFVLA